MPTLKEWVAGIPSSNDDRSKKDAINQEYISKIDRFLNHVEGRFFIKFARRGNPLGDILDFSQQLYQERSKVDDTVNKQLRELDRREEKIKNVQREIEQLEQERERLQWEKNELDRRHMEEVESMTLGHSMDMEEQKNLFHDKIDTQKINFEDKIQTIEKMNWNDMDAIGKKNKKDMDVLVGQLLVSQRDDQGWPDDKMEINFKELRRIMDGITAPRNREFLITSGKGFPAQLDTPGFLSRVGNQKSHFLLKSKLWNVIREHYFSAPFGFGVLGPVSFQADLLGMYTGWRRLFDAGSVAVSPAQDDYSIFAQDGSSNKWRSSAFQYISIVLKDPSKSHSLITHLNAQNFNMTVSCITEILSSISNAPLRPEILAQVKQMVTLSRDIALQFGIQPAQFQLVIPREGQKIKIGDKYHDCEDGDSFKGRTPDVLLVTAPGLRKVGDGKEDLLSERAIVPAEIYPAETYD